MIARMTQMRGEPLKNHGFTRIDTDVEEVMLKGRDIPSPGQRPGINGKT